VGAFDNVFAIGVELVTINVRVRVDEHYLLQKGTKSTKTGLLFCAFCAFLRLI
jgi:hypothetical protein